MTTTTAPETTAPGWLRGYALLALRVNQQVTRTSGGTVLIYRGPAEWRAEVEAEAPRAPGGLVEDAERLLAGLPAAAPRSTYLAAQVRALRAVARRLNGEDLPQAEYARQTLGVTAAWVPESRLAAAHEQLDTALPRTGGSLTDRLHAWQAAHTLPQDRMDHLPELVGRAVTETRARTSAVVPLPHDEEVGCQLVDSAHFLAAGHYAGGVSSTIHVNRSVPFNLADLLYVVAHEGHPGHIAESLLKERHLVERKGFLDQQVRFMLSPSFVLSEGLGLNAQALVFPGDQAQAWLTDHIFPEYGIQPDGSDFAAIHQARTVLWGAWANAALLAAEGCPDQEVAGYLTRWALLAGSELGAARATLGAAGMHLYLLAYYHGWRLVASWLDAPDQRDRLRRLLTEQLLPADLTPRTAQQEPGEDAAG